MCDQVPRRDERRQVIVLWLCQIPAHDNDLQGDKDQQGFQLRLPLNLCTFSLLLMLVPVRAVYMRHQMLGQGCTAQIGGGVTLMPNSVMRRLKEALARVQFLAKSFHSPP